LIQQQAARSVTVTLGSCHFQNIDNLPSVIAERSIAAACIKRLLANGEELNRSWLLKHQLTMLLTAFAAYCLYHRVETADRRLSWLIDLKIEKARKSLRYIKAV